MRVELHDVSKTYGTARALDRVSATLDPGKVVAVLGSNGAGKSTLLRILSGIIRPDNGKVLYDGARLVPDDLALRRRIFFLPDFPPVFAGESVLSNLGLLLRIYEADGPDAPAKVLRWMEAFDLLGLAEKPVETLSRGQSYKAALVALLAIDPDLWLLDEPMASGMDPHGLAILRTELRNAAARGRIVVFTTQILEAAERLADVACIFQRGSLSLMTSIDDMRKTSVTGTDGVIEALLRGLRDP